MIGYSRLIEVFYSILVLLLIVLDFRSNPSLPVLLRRGSIIARLLDDLLDELLNWLIDCSIA